MSKLPVLKLLITISIFCCVFANGICSNIYSPTWLDLTSLMNQSLKVMSFSISLRAMFFCGGAMMGAFIYKFVDRGLLYPLFIITKGLCVALIPLYGNFNLFLAYSAIIGLVSGAADTSVNVWMIDIWQDKSAPFVQALQFFWSVGFIVSPLISNPFLTPESKKKALDKFNDTISTTVAPVTEKLVASINHTVYETTTEFPMTNNFPTTTSLPVKDDLIVSSEEHLITVKNSKLYIAYGIAGAICLIGSVSLLVIYIYRKIEKITNANAQTNNEDAKKQKDNISENDEFESHQDLQYTYSKKYLIQILLFVGLMTSVFCASEMTTLQFAVTFCVKLDLGLSKFYGSMVMTAIATSFAAGRFFGILCAIRFKPLYILWADWIIMLLGNLVLLLSNSAVEFLWIGAILLGFGFASFFAALFSYLRDRIKVDTFISSMIILSSLSGNAIGFPVFVGKYLDTKPLMMVYANLFCVFIMFVCFMGLTVLDCKYGIKTDIVKRLRKEQEPNEMKEKLKVHLSDNQTNESANQIEKLVAVDNQPNEVKVNEEEK